MNSPERADGLFKMAAAAGFGAAIVAAVGIGAAFHSNAVAALLFCASAAACLWGAVRLWRAAEAAMGIRR